jgi:hypothetical protein
MKIIKKYDIVDNKICFKSKEVGFVNDSGIAYMYKQVKQNIFLKLLGIKQEFIFGYIKQFEIKNSEDTK